MKSKIRGILGGIFLGKRYHELQSISDQVRYMTLNSIFMVAIIPLVLLGITMVSTDLIRAIIDFTIAGLCLLSLILIRSKLPLALVPVFPATVFGAYCVYLVYLGDLNLWAAIWLFSFPPIVIFTCRMTVGTIESALAIVVSAIILYMSPSLDNAIRSRFILAYFLIFSLTVIYERISILKDRKEKVLTAELAQERDVIQTMKDNINQGIFLMDKEFKILPQYSKPLVTILSYYDSELAGKNFLDILSGSMDARQLKTMQSFFSMIFSKSKSARVLESANPISEFEYKIDDRKKTLSTKFQLIEKAGSESFVIGIIQDISREKEFEMELKAQKDAQELEMKNMFEVIQIDPLVFQDFIEDIEANFNYINDILKDSSLQERQAAIKFFQIVHAIKSNALILGMENFGHKLHILEDDIKKVSSQDDIELDDILTLVIKLETLMQEKDNYIKIIKKVEAFKTSNRSDTVLIYSLTKAVEKLSVETQKRVEIKAGQLDLKILESKLRKPIKDILFQCVRNAVFHGIEPVEERLKKNKPPQGLLAFNVKNNNGMAEITFSDDGQGLNWEKIKAKYQKMYPENTNITKNVLLSSIFTPEFSTSEETNMVAGRGVGLSLVKDIVKDNDGVINVNSTESGLTFKFTFPIPA